MTTGLLNPTHLILLLLDALIILGPKRLPQAARSLERGMREFRDGITGDAEPPAQTSYPDPPAPPAAITSTNRLTRMAAPSEHRKANVLAALSSDGALTAGEVANATGLARPTVSTTLSKLSKTGHVVTADRGYRLPSTSGASASAVEPATAATTADA